MKIEWDSHRVWTEIKGDCEQLTRQAAEVVANQARAECPVGRTVNSGKKHGSRKAGTLRDSIRVYKSKYDRVSYIVMVGGKGKWGDAWYARFVELGTPGDTKNSTLGSYHGNVRVSSHKSGSRNVGSYLQGRKMTIKQISSRKPIPPNPFMGRALDKTRAKVLRIYQEAFKKAA